MCISQVEYSNFRKYKLTGEYRKCKIRQLNIYLCRIYRLFDEITPMITRLTNSVEDQDLSNYHEWYLLKNIYFIGAGG